MQWQNEPKITTPSETHEQAPYMNTSHYYEQPSGAQQTFQEQMYHPPVAGYNALPQQQSPIVALPPLTASQLAAIFSYSFGWVTGLLFVLFGGRDRFIRFHAMQSLIFFGAITLIDIGLFKIMFGEWYEYDIRFIPLLCFLLVLAVNSIGFIGWIVTMIQTARGAYFKLPIVGELIARRMNLQNLPHQ